MDQGVEEGCREPIGIDVVNFFFDSAWIKWKIGHIIYFWRMHNLLILVPLFFLPVPKLISFVRQRQMICD
jgi:hypothetical protein